VFFTTAGVVDGRCFWLKQQIEENSRKILAKNQHDRHEFFMIRVILCIGSISSSPGFAEVVMTMDEIIIRLAVMDDYDDLCRLFVQLDEHHVELRPDLFHSFPAPPREREWVQELIESREADCIVAEVAGRIVGFIHIHKSAHPPYPMFKPHEFAMIDNAIVDHSHRSGGVGALLMQEARRWTAEHGLRFMQTNVYAANTGSLHFFKQHGFSTLSEKLELAVDD
jgi:ribosomal protein S18 acetylase RimI-like enzyme